MSKGLPLSHSRSNEPVRTIHRSIPLRDLVINVAATGSAIGFGTAVIEGLPQGNLLLQGAVVDLIFTGPTSANLVDTWEGDFSVGTAPTADNALSGGEVDIVPSTALAAATAEVSPRTAGRSTDTENGVIHDNTAGTLELNLNMLIDAAHISDDQNVNLTVNGALHLAIIVLGDD